MFYSKKPNGFGSHRSMYPQKQVNTNETNKGSELSLYQRMSEKQKKRFWFGMLAASTTMLLLVIYRKKTMFFAEIDEALDELGLGNNDYDSENNVDIDNANYGVGVEDEKIFQEIDPESVYDVGNEDNVLDVRVQAKNAMKRALGEWKRGVREPSEHTAIDMNGNIYTCDNGMQPIGEQNITNARILKYILGGLGRPMRFYSNDEKGSCSSAYFPWCGAFASWCWHRVKASERYDYFGGCSKLFAWGKQDPRRKVPLDKIQTGDILVFCKNGGSETGHHIGLCAKVDGGVVTTIEGNGEGTHKMGRGLQGVVIRTRYFKETRPDSNKAWIAYAYRPTIDDLE